MKILKITLFAIGGVLLLVNFSGLFKSMRNPEIYEEEKIIRNRIDDITISYPEIIPMLVQKENESRKDFSIRVNMLVKDGFSHYWKAAGIDKYHLRVPVWENYMLYAASFINPRRYERYEFTDYHKNLERGVGLCSTHSTVVKGVLNDHGIDADLLDIAGHVVVRAEVEEGVWYMLDPDYGIVVPYDTAEIHANPEIVRPYYADLASQYYEDAVDPYTTDHVVELYGREGNHIYRVYNRFEEFSYWAIWLLPLLLMAPFGVSYLTKRGTRTSEGTQQTVPAS